MKSILLFLTLFNLFSCSKVTEVQNKPVGSWGETINKFQCRIMTCKLVPNNDKDYSTRIKIGIQIQNVSETKQKIRILAPISGQPLLGIMIKSGNNWTSIGNATKGPKSKKAIYEVAPQKIILVEYSEGLTNKVVDNIKNGRLIKGIIGTYGKHISSNETLHSSPIKMN